MTHDSSIFFAKAFWSLTEHNAVKVCIYREREMYNYVCIFLFLLSPLYLNAFKTWIYA